MQRIITILQKLNELATAKDHTVIDIDLMMDYTRVIYADLIEQRNRQQFTDRLSPDPQPGVQGEQTPVTEMIPAAGRHAEIFVPGHSESTASNADADQHSEHERREQQLASELFLPASAKPAHDIRSLIGINDKYQFISELFGNNKEGYEEVLDELNLFDNRDDALNFLQLTGITERYHWDEEQYSVQSFHQLLGKFYSRT